MRSSANLERWDKRHVWHPFAQMREWEREPLVIIERGDGNYLIDTNGKRYLDGVSSLWCNVHGHRVAALDRALKDQAGKIAHSTFLGLSHVSAIELSRELVSLAPRGLSRVFYSDSGSAAVEVALKMAYQYWQLKGQKSKTRFLKLKNAYHGDTIGSVSVGGIPLFHEIFGPLLFKAYEAEAPYRYRDDYEGSEAGYAAFCAAKVEMLLRKYGSQIAALVVEPLIQGAAGMLTQPRGYLSRIAALARRYDTLLIVDEVATGFGRTGTMFACEQERVRPDLMCLAKGLTAGYLPLSVTLTTEAVYRAFLGRYEEFKAFFHGHTYSANPLACAVALENLRLFRRARVLERLEPKIGALEAELSKIRRLPHVGEIRQAGLMVGIELVSDSSTKAPYAPSDRIGHRVCLEARRLGVMLRPLGNVIVLMPPLSITRTQLIGLCRVVARSIETVTERRT